MLSKTNSEVRNWGFRVVHHMKFISQVSSMTPTAAPLSKLFSQGMRGARGSWGDMFDVANCPWDMWVYAKPTDSTLYFIPTKCWRCRHFGVMSNKAIHRPTRYASYSFNSWWAAITAKEHKLLPDFVNRKPLRTALRVIAWDSEIKQLVV